MGNGLCVSCLGLSLSQAQTTPISGIESDRKTNARLSEISAHWILIVAPDLYVQIQLITQGLHKQEAYPRKTAILSLCMICVGWAQSFSKRCFLSSWSAFFSLFVQTFSISSSWFGCKWCSEFGKCLHVEKLTAKRFYVWKQWELKTLPIFLIPKWKWNNSKCVLFSFCWQSKMMRERQTDRQRETERDRETETEWWKKWSNSEPCLAQRNVASHLIWHVAVSFKHVPCCFVNEFLLASLNAKRLQHFN